jgi:predicted ATP-grasp superfamily ATP-dependent carboligase
MAEFPGAIILGNEYQALGLLRQLARSGIPCVLLDQDAWGVARFSRYRCRFHRAPRYASDEFWPWLVRLAHEQGYLGWLPVATDDEQVRHFAQHYEEACALFRYAGLPWASYQHIYNKRLAYPWAQSLGAPVPRTFMPEHREHLPGEGWPFPAIIKPAVKREYGRYTRRKAIRVETRAELQQVLNGLLAPVPIEHLMVQELIPGDGSTQWSYAGFFVEGRPVAAYTACRRRQHPPDFGRASTYVVAMPNEEVEAQSRRLLGALGYTGLAEVEWKRDARDGQLKFLEINARCWGWHTLSEPVVGNLPKMLYDYLIYQSVQPVSPRYGFRWVKWVTDVPVAIELMRRGELAWRDYWASIRGSSAYGDWDAQDPLPFLLQFALVPYLLKTRGY